MSIREHIFEEAVRNLGAVISKALGGDKNAKLDFYDRVAIECAARGVEEPYLVADKLWNERRNFLLPRANEFFPRARRPITHGWDPYLGPDGYKP